MSSIEIDGVNGIIKNTVSDADITIKGNDGGSEISAVTFDMSDAGTATFNHDIKLSDSGVLRLGDDADAHLQDVIPVSYTHLTLPTRLSV